MKSKKTSYTELTALVEKWQKILRLEAWELKYDWASYSDMDGAEATINICYERNSAQLRFLRSEDADSNAHPAYSLEDSVVHELLHIWLEPCKIDDEQKMFEERAICVIVKALLREEESDGA